MILSVLFNRDSDLVGGFVVDGVEEGGGEGVGAGGDAESAGDEGERGGFTIRFGYFNTV